MEHERYECVQLAAHNIAMCGRYLLFMKMVFFVSKDVYQKLAYE